MIINWWTRSSKSTKIILILVAATVAFIAIFLIMAWFNREVLESAVESYIITGELTNEEAGSIAPVLFGFMFLAILSVVIGLFVGWKIIKGTMKSIKGPGLKNDLSALFGVVPKINNRDR